MRMALGMWDQQNTYIIQKIAGGPDESPILRDLRSTGPPRARRGKNPSSRHGGILVINNIA